MKQKTVTLNQSKGILLELPVLEFGSGSPRSLIISGLHGDEATGLLILKKFAETLKRRSVPGTVAIMPTVNPLGRWFNSRTDPFSGADLNRVVGRTKENTVSDQILKVILEQGSHSDLVVDIHTMMPHSLVLAIFMNAGGKVTKEKSLAAIGRFGPEAIWQLSPQTKNEAEFSGSLGPILATRGIVNFAIETPAPEKITKTQEAKILAGLEKLVFATTGEKRDLPRLERSATRAESSGLFVPASALKLSKHVKSGEVLGEIVQPDLDSCSVKASISGEVISHFDRRSVRQGEEIISLGRKI